MEEFQRRICLGAIILVALVEIILLAAHKWRFASGFLAGSAWSLANSLFTIGLLKIAILQQSRKKMPLILLLKFPLLYFMGFTILNLKYYPLSSLFTGAILILAVTGAANIWPKRT